MAPTLQAFSACCAPHPGGWFTDGWPPKDDAASIRGVDVKIRAAESDDLDLLLGLLRQLNPDDPPLDARTADAVWEQIQAQTGRTVLVADTGAALVGTLDSFLVANLTRNGRPILFIENVIVAVDHRRARIGSRLLQAAIDIARSSGCYKAQLLAADDPQACAFYEACGFARSAQGYRRYFCAPTAVSRGSG
jgi:GNAT superfamily N-acetyltransferase